jgi:hypothetical protein
MSKALAAVSVLVSVVSVGVAVWALDEARQARTLADAGPAARGRKDALEARLERLEAQAGSPGRAPTPYLGEGVAGSGSASMPGIPGTSADPARAALDGPPPEEGLRALVRQTVKEEIDTRQKEQKEQGAGKDETRGEGRKPPLSQVAAELDLDDAQREAVHQAVIRGQEETIALLRTPTPGGRVPIDDLLKAFLEKPEVARERAMEVFAMLATEKVPGSEETYAQRLEGVKKSTAETFRRSFTPEQFKAYEKTGQDPLEIQVPDSPWIQIIQEAWKKNR